MATAGAHHHDAWSQHHLLGDEAGGQGVFSGTLAERASFIALLVLLALCALGGGSSFQDTMSLLYLRPAAVLCIGLFLLLPGPLDLRTFRIPFLLLAAVAGITALQLVPLPPDLWLSLPGRARYGEAAAAAGLAQPWRPLTLTPDLTWNSLVGLVVPATVLIGMAKIRPDQREALVLVLVVICTASAVLAVLQFASGGRGPLYFYTRTNSGVPVGLLANRNHQAAFLALAFPLLRVWLAMREHKHGATGPYFWIAIGIGMLMVPLILATGSRAGMMVAVVAFAATFWLVPGRRPSEGEPGPGRWAALAKVAVPLLAAVLVFVSLQFGRGLSIERLTGAAAIENDPRLRFFPVVADIAREFFPFGTGIGSFSPVFRNFEPDSALGDRYINQAHNDLLELAMTAGAPGLAVLAAFLIWAAVRGYSAFIGAERRSHAASFVRLGLTMVVVLFLASLVDYPLRTPLLNAVFVVACGWLCHRPRDKEATASGLSKAAQ